MLVYLQYQEEIVGFLIKMKYLNLRMQLNGPLNIVRNKDTYLRLIYETLWAMYFYH